jgi:hypothetical protein
MKKSSFQAFSTYLLLTKVDPYPCRQYYHCNPKDISYGMKYESPRKINGPEVVRSVSRETGRISKDMGICFWKEGIGKTHCLLLKQNEHKGYDRTE